MCVCVLPELPATSQRMVYGQADEAFEEGNKKKATNPKILTMLPYITIRMPLLKVVGMISVDTSSLYKILVLIRTR